MAETSMGLSYSESMLTFKQNLQRRVSPSIFIAVKSLKRTDRRKLIFIQNIIMKTMLRRKSVADIYEKHEKKYYIYILV